MASLISLAKSLPRMEFPLAQQFSAVPNTTAPQLSELSNSTRRAQAPVSYGGYGTQPVAAAPVPPPPTPMFGGPAIRIATFNIQVFGDKKASNPNVMMTLASIIQHFQIVAIQEIRTKDDYFIDNFLRTYVNASGRAYDKVIGPRMGRSEQQGAVRVHLRYDCDRSQSQQHLHGERPGQLARARPARGDVPRAWTTAGASLHVRPG